MSKMSKMLLFTCLCFAWAILMAGLASTTHLYGQDFTKITSGPVISDTGPSIGANWGDYDDDGFLDLVVVHASGAPNSLYHNNGDGTFTRVTQGGIVTDAQNSSGACWGDYDNDEDLDLFVTNLSGQDFLYKNNGDGTFATALRTAVLSASDRECTWSDFDQDGFLDLFITIRFNQNNALYRNNGDGTLTPITSGPVVSDGRDSGGAVWGDMDNDGDPDLFVANGSGQNNALYRNNGDGTFSEITSGPVVSDGKHSTGGSWGDFDNDGDLDLFVTNGSVSNDLPQSNVLYLNNGDGTFAEVTSGPFSADIFTSVSGAWGDYDNDGNLDLFVSNQGLFTSQGIIEYNDNLYRNDGAGTFTRITTGSVVNENGFSEGAAWADYDNDGDLDLMIANQFGPDFLYTNDGNANTWINIRLRGTISNRSAIGARVRILASINDRDVWQMAEISGKTSRASQGSLNVEFGLGDASSIERVEIDWPSGIWQTLTDVDVNQFLVVVEGVESDVTPPEVHAALVPVGDHQYRVECAAEDDSGEDPDIQAHILTPDLEHPRIITHNWQRHKLTYDLLENEITIRAPNPLVFLDDINAAGGVSVNPGTIFTIHAGDSGHDIVEYTLSAQEVLTMIDGGQAVLRCTATDGSGNTTSIEVAQPPANPRLVGASASAILQNHPNPFNPTTTIEFALPEAVPVSLKVFDVTGREVARLVEGSLSAGRHQVTFEATELPSGVYLYRLAAGSFTETRRMVLMK